MTVSLKHIQSFSFDIWRNWRWIYYSTNHTVITCNFVCCRRDSPLWRMQVMMSYKQNGGLRYLDEKMTEMPLGMNDSFQTKAKPCLKIPFRPCLHSDIHLSLRPLCRDVCLWMDPSCCVTHLFDKLTFVLFCASENAQRLFVFNLFSMTKGKGENMVNWTKCSKNG